MTSKGEFGEPWKWDPETTAVKMQDRCDDAETKRIRSQRAIDCVNAMDGHDPDILDWCDKRFNWYAKQVESMRAVCEAAEAAYKFLTEYSTANAESIAPALRARWVGEQQELGMSIRKWKKSNG